METIVRFFFIFLFLHIPFSCQKEKVHEDKLSEEEYMISDNISNQNVTSFAEDSKGYVWIGTIRGLNKYNGYTYSQYLKSENNLQSISGNSINSMLTDSQNRLWVATDKGISFFDDKGLIHRVEIDKKEYPPVQILENKKGEIIINLCSHLCKYDPVNNIFKAFYTFDQYNMYNKVHVDKDDNLWTVSLYSVECLDRNSSKPIKSFRMDKFVNIFYSYLIGDKLYIQHGKGGLKIIDIQSKEYCSIPYAIKRDPVLSHSLITIIHPYRDNQILINTHKNGIYIYDYEKDLLIDQRSDNFPFEISDYVITSLFTDKNNNLWIGTQSNGFRVIYAYNEQFNDNQALQKLSKEQHIIALATDEKENLWFATHSDNLYVFNLRNENVNHIDLKKFFPEDPYYQDKILSILPAGNDTVWLKTEAKLIQCYYKGNNLIRLKTFFFHHYLYNIAKDKKGILWTDTSMSDLYTVSKGADSPQKMKNYQGTYPSYKSCMLTLSTGEILVITSHAYLDVINPDNWEIKNYSLENIIDKEHFIPTAAYEDSDRNIWIAIQDRALIKYSLANEKASLIKNIPGKDIVSIIEDKDKNLWLGTLSGLVKYDRQLNQFFSFYTYDGIGSNQFSKNSVVRLANNHLIFGGTHGLTVFNPSDIDIKRQIPLYFEEIVSASPVINNNINLKYNQNKLDISFIALDYSKYPRIRYHYKLEGLQDNWIDAGTNRTVSYSNVPPGKYTFRVYITSNDNADVLAENSLNIDISPSPWLSIWALLLYGIILLAVIVYINRLYLKIRVNKSMVQMALREKEQERHINEMNMSFFTNISHEFRTPLTMIAGPISTILKDESLSSENKHLLSTVNRSVSRLLRLVNQILEINKLENDTLSLNLSYVDIIHEINEAIEIYAVNSNMKDLTINTTGLQSSFFMVLDKDSLEKILNNILSNAFKHSPERGNINIHFNVISNTEVSALLKLAPIQDTEYIKIEVEDEGVGIPDNELENIFLKYYQVNNTSSKGGYNWGTGIGLYFTKLLVAMHDGFIKAENRPEKGMIFTVILPIKEFHPDLYQQQTQNEKSNIKLSEESYTFDQKRHFEKQYTILVIDDDVEVSAYLNTLLHDTYNIINKYRADDAYDEIDNINPDLILCDILMPGISGYEFCRKMKQNTDYSHIPVILLTAKSTTQEQIHGLEIGANAYIPKPFNPDYLTATIKSQILNLENIRNLLRASTVMPHIDNSLSLSDQRFMEKLYELMESELSNSDLNISEISKKMGMSRTKFYLKMKGLTGETPNVFFVRYKLNQAARLIKSGEYNISEVSILTGFSTLSHFSVSFKKQFGVSPKEYK